MLSVELEELHVGEGAARWYGTGLFLALKWAKGRQNIIELSVEVFGYMDLYINFVV